MIEVPMPPVRYYCKRCEKVEPNTDHEAYGVVSPNGVAHIGVDYGDTACGIDATGDQWWWRL